MKNYPTTVIAPITSVPEKRMKRENVFWDLPWQSMSKQSGSIRTDPNDTKRKKNTSKYNDMVILHAPVVGDVTG